MLERMWKKGNPLTLLVGVQNDTVPKENSRESPLKTRNETTIRPSNPTVGIYLEETRTEKDTCTPMLSAALFTLAVNNWKQARCPSADEWIRKSWYLYTKDYFAAIKRNAFESVLMRWMNLEPIKDSEVSHKEEDKYRTLTHTYIWNLERCYQWSCIQGSKGDTDVKNRPLDSVGQGEDGMIWGNSTETYTLPNVNQMTRA